MENITSLLILPSSEEVAFVKRRKPDESQFGGEAKKPLLPTTQGASPFSVAIKANITFYSNFCRNVNHIHIKSILLNQLLSQANRYEVSK